MTKTVQMKLIECITRLPGLDNDESLRVKLPKKSIVMVEAETVKEFIVYLNSILVEDNGKFGNVIDEKFIGIDFGPTIMNFELIGDPALVKQCYAQMLNLRDRKPLKV